MYILFNKETTYGDYDDHDTIINLCVSRYKDVLEAEKQKYIDNYNIYLKELELHNETCKQQNEWLRTERIKFWTSNKHNIQNPSRIDGLWKEDKTEYVDGKFQFRASGMSYDNYQEPKVHTRYYTELEISEKQDYQIKYYLSGTNQFGNLHYINVNNLVGEYPTAIPFDYPTPQGHAPETLFIEEIKEV